MSINLLADSISWGLAEPWYISQHIEPHAMVRLSVVIFTIVVFALSWKIGLPGFSLFSAEPLRRGKIAAIYTTMLLALAVSASGWLSNLPRLSQQDNPAIKTALISLLQPNFESRFLDMPPENVVTPYR